MLLRHYPALLSKSVIHIKLRDAERRRVRLLIIIRCSELVFFCISFADWQNARAIRKW